MNRQKRFLQIVLRPLLAEAINNNDGSIDETDLKKINQYYGLAIPAILGEALCLLRGTKMTSKERESLTYQGALTVLVDNFFDKPDIPSASVQQFMEDPTGIEGKTVSEKLFLTLYKKAAQYPRFDEMKKYLHKVYQAQIESKKQAKPGLSKDELYNIMMDKGGWSVLFYRTFLSHPIQPGEEEALYTMGGLMQFGNDIFDVYSDCKEGINTLMSTATRVKEVRQQFQSLMEKIFALSYKAGYGKKNVRKYLRYIDMCLCSRCFVCLDQLEKKEKETNNIFTPHQYSREELVCDMDKASNKWKTIKYFMSLKLKTSGS